MIKVDIYRKNSVSYFNGVKLDLLPTELVIIFSTKIFNMKYDDIKNYSYDLKKSEDITIEFKNARNKFIIVIKPYTREHHKIIREHLDKYCKNKLEYVNNPLFNVVK